MRSEDACPSDSGRKLEGQLGGIWWGRGCSHPVALTFPGRNQKIREVASWGPKAGWGVLGKSCRIWGDTGQMRKELPGSCQSQAEVMKRVSPSPRGFLLPDPRLGLLTHSRGYTHWLKSIHLLIHNFAHINTWICTGDLFLFLLPHNLHTMQYIDLSVQLFWQFIPS